MAAQMARNVGLQLTEGAVDQFDAVATQAQPTLDRIQFS